MFASRRLFLAALLLAFAGWSLPAHASVRADFNGDGILDTATLEPGSPPVIKVTLSGRSRTLRLVIPERPLSLAAADVDADGRVDLVGTSRSRGLFFWRNRPGERFKSEPRRLSKKIHLRVRTTAAEVLKKPPRDKSDDTSIDSAGADDTPAALDTRTRADTVARAGSRLLLTASTHLRFGYQRSSPSRAPPA
jgi:hypothetical protein